MTAHEAWLELSRTIGMLCEGETGNPAPTDPAGLLECALSLKLVPPELIPLLRSAVDSVKCHAWSPALRDTLLRLKYKVSGPVGHRMTRVALQSVGYEVKNAAEWMHGTPGVFARRRDQTLYVVPVFTREDPAQPSGEEFLMSYLSLTIEKLRQSKEFARDFPGLVIVQSSDMITTFSHRWVEKGPASLPPYDEFMLPFDQLPFLAGRLHITFPPEA